MLLPENMEKVCEDAGPSVWFYNKPEDKYYRVYDRTREYKAIRGQSLPDPEILLAERMKKAAVDRKRVNIKALECSPATKCLWEHRKSRSLHEQVTHHS